MGLERASRELSLLQDELEKKRGELDAVRPEWETTPKRLSGNDRQAPAGGPATNGRPASMAVDTILDRGRSGDEPRGDEERNLQAQKLAALGVMAGGVAHNLNNILAVILGHASLRKDMTTDISELESCDIICHACRQGRDVVRSLVQFAQPTLFTRNPFELHAFLNEAWSNLKGTLPGKVRLGTHLAGTSAWIDGDAQSFQSAFANLVQNSVEAMPQGGTLILRSFTLEKDWVEIHLEDSGLGMSPELLARAMEPFFTTKPVGRGVGMGLSMAYGVIKAHGGKLELSSAPGKGTLVKIRLPRIPA